MKKVFAAFALLLILVAGGANAQVLPYFQVFFPHPDDPSDPYFWQESVVPVCDGVTANTLYVVGKNLQAWVIGAEFQVAYPPMVTWLGDVPASTLTLGATPTGFSAVWTIQQNGFLPLLLVSAIYTCTECPPDSPITVIPNSVTGFLGFTDAATTLVPVIGMTSTFCPLTVPTEDTTWGQVKALFE